MAPARAPDRRLIAAARSLFARKGFDGATLGEISRTAGLNYGSVVYHFGSKRALYDAVVASCARPLEECARDAAGAGGPPGERLRGVARALSGHVRQEPDVAVLLLQEVAVGRPPPAPTVRVLRELLALIAGLARDARALGEIRRASPATLAHGVVGQLLGGSLVERAAEPEADLPAMARSAVRPDPCRFLEMVLEVPARDG